MDTGLYLTFQLGGAQGVVGQPEQLHIGPVAHVQWYAQGLEVEVFAEDGNAMSVSQGTRYEDYSVQTIKADAPLANALAPFNGMMFGSVIIHDGGEGWTEFFFADDVDHATEQAKDANPFTAIVACAFVPYKVDASVKVTQ